MPVIVSLIPTGVNLCWKSFESPSVNTVQNSLIGLICEKLGYVKRRLGA